MLSTTRNRVLVLVLVLVLQVLLVMSAAACSSSDAAATAPAPAAPAAPPGPPPPPPLPAIAPIPAADLARFASYRWTAQRGPWGEIMVPEYWQEVPPALVGVTAPTGSTLAAGWGKRGEYGKWDSLHVFVERIASATTRSPETFVSLVNYAPAPAGWRSPDESRAQGVGNVRGQIASWRGFGLARYDILDRRNAIAGAVERGDNRYWIICISNSTCTAMLGTFAPPTSP